MNAYVVRGAHAGNLLQQQCCNSNGANKKNKRINRECVWLCETDGMRNSQNND